MSILITLMSLWGFILIMLFILYLPIKLWLRRHGDEDTQAMLAEFDAEGGMFRSGMRAAVRDAKESMDIPEGESYWSDLRRHGDESFQRAYANKLARRAAAAQRRADRAAQRRERRGR